MILTQPCSHCGVALEYEAEQNGEIMGCAACGNNTLLNGTARRESKPALYKPGAAAAEAFRPTAKMTQCPDCDQVISRRAFMCPTCGSCAGIRFRLVWDVMCLIGLITLIFAAIAVIISALFTGALKAMGAI